MDKINSVTLANKVPTPMTRAPFTHFGGLQPPSAPPAYATALQCPWCENGSTETTVAEGGRSRGHDHDESMELASAAVDGGIIGCGPVFQPYTTAG